MLSSLQSNNHITPNFPSAGALSDSETNRVLHWHRGIQTPTHDTARIQRHWKLAHVRKVVPEFYRHPNYNYHTYSRIKDYIAMSFLFPLFGSLRSENIRRSFTLQAVCLGGRFSKGPCSQHKSPFFRFIAIAAQASSDGRACSSRNGEWGHTLLCQPATAVGGWPVSKIHGVGASRIGRPWIPCPCIHGEASAAEELALCPAAAQAGQRPQQSRCHTVLCTKDTHINLICTNDPPQQFDLRAPTTI